MLLTVGSHLIQSRVAYIPYLIVMTFKIIDFEGKNREKFIHVTADIPYPIPFPGPYLRGNIVPYRYAETFADLLCQREVKPCIVNEYDNIGGPSGEIFKTEFCPTQYGPQMHYYRPESHIGKFSVMFYQSTSHRRHLVSSEIAEIGIGISFQYRFHQVGGMQITRCLADDNIVFHNVNYTMSKLL